MLVIIEGPDCAGKTTLAENMRRYTACKVLHRGPPEDDAFVEYTADLQSYQPEAIGANVVCDRWHWGELVYGPMLRGESKLDEEAFRAVEDFLLVRGAVVAYLWDTPAELARRLVQRGDDLVKGTDAEEMLTRYETVAWESRLPVFRLRAPTPGDALDVWHASRLASRGAKERFFS